VPNFINIEEKEKDLQINLYEISDDLEERIKQMSTDLDTQREGTATVLAYIVAIF